MGKIYKQLSVEERAMIQAQLSMGRKPGQIVRELGRSAGTLSRELKRNGWASEPAMHVSPPSHRPAAERQVRFAVAL